MSLDIFKSKEVENSIKDKFEQDGEKWEKVHKRLEEIDTQEDIDIHLYELDTKSGDYIEKYYIYLKGILEKKGGLKIKTKEELRESAENFLEKKLSGIPIVGDFLIDVFGWVKDSKKEGASFMNKYIWGPLGAGILGFFGGNFFEKYNKSINGLNDILDNKKINDVKGKIKKYLLSKISGKDIEITKKIDNLSEKQILMYYNDIENGKGFSMKKIKKDFGSIGNFGEVLSGELENIDKEAFNKISKYISNTYSKQLNEGQKIELKGLIKKYITNESLSNEKLQEIFDKKSFKMNELYPLLGDGMMFALELVGKGIISVLDMSWNFVGSSTEIINIAIPGIGLSGNTSTESLLEKLNNMNSDERASLIGLLYRKGGIFFNAMGSFSASIARIGLDIVLPSNTGVDGLKLFKDGFKGPSAQFRNISKLEQAITGVANNIYITKIEGSINIIKDNYKLISIVKNSGDIEGFKKYLNGKHGNLIKKYLPDNFDINKYKDLDEISKSISKKIGTKFTDDIEFKFSKNKNHLLKEKSFGFGKSASMQNLNRALEDVSKHQKNILDKGFGVFSKFRETLAVSKISHLSDKLVFEFENKKGAKAFLKQMNVMAQTSPELIKGIFNKLPIISVLGFSVASDKPFLEELQNEMLYLIPLVGPIMLFGDSGFSWDENSLHVDNPEKALLGGALIGVDAVFWSSDILNGKGIKGKFFNLVKYPVKPFIDIMDIGKGTAEFIQKGYKTVKTLKGGKEILKQAVQKTKGLKGRYKILGITAILLLGGNIVYAQEGLEKYKGDNGKIDYEKMRLNYKSMEKSEQIKFIRLLFTSESNNILDIQIKENIEITSRDKTKLNGDWFIDSNEKYIFEEITGKKIIFVD